MRLLILITVACVVNEADCFPKTLFKGDLKDGVVKQVHVLFRHGHRAPLMSFPKDINKNASHWPYGSGELTNIGRQQGYQLGQYLRSRYGCLLPKERAWTKVHATSSDLSRALMTAQLVLAGLLPPEAGERWSDLNWQPVPIHTVPVGSDDKLIFPESCPKLRVMLNNMTDRVPDDKQELYDYISNNTGLSITTSKTMYNIHSVLEIQKEFGLPLPCWANEVFPELTEKETNRYLHKVAETKLLIQLAFGPLLDHLLKYDPNTPIKLYSTHDEVLGGLLAALGIKDLKPPGFTAALVLEYREDREGEVHVQMWWKDGPNSTFEQLKWPHCGIRCPVKKFKEMLDPFIPKNWNILCYFNDPSPFFRNKVEDFHDFIVATVGVLTLFLCCFLLIMSKRWFDTIYYEQLA